MSTLRRSARLASKAPAVYYPRPKDVVDKRIEAEMNEFDDPVYASEFQDVIHVNDNTVRVTHTNGKVYEIHRNRDIIASPPNILNVNTNAKLDNCGVWYPSLTSLRWFLMLTAE
jgi:hypothetical protein